jgi:ADP-ribose pyrophosphatase YjhB (NUDIX family)
MNIEALFQIADEMRGVANQGLLFAENDYDRQRYEKILAFSARLVGALENRQSEEIMMAYRENYMHISPVNGADAVVFRGDKILLVQRDDNRLWAVPGGLVEVGETLAKAAIRELWEETGLQGQVLRLLAILDSRIWKSGLKFHLFHYLIEIEVDAGVQPRVCPETLANGFFSEDELPPLSPGHNHWVPFLFKLKRGEVPVPFLDPAV